MLVDVHCHLDDSRFEDLDPVIERAKKAGVVTVINNGASPSRNRKTLDICKKYKIVKKALGFYPGEIIEFSDSDIEEELKWIEKQKPIALGEIGLDFTFGEHEKQEKYFRKFIELGAKLDIPLIIHTRKAERRIVEILEELKPRKVVLHCFSGKLKLLKRVEGVYFSVPPIIVNSVHFQELVKKVPLTRLLTETDAPWMAPVKGEINEPANVAVTVKEIAKIKGITVEECTKAIYANYQGLF
ncbi:TatD family hydrolase [archaeon]|jgi:TatD DNase family protein|nr:TatD family hydrolase [archaeon]MBT4417160.1 TatD family hydrolase [archaeon]